MKRLETVGFWFNPEAPGPYPRPQLLRATWQPPARAAMLARLRGGATFETYRGVSWCRFACGIADAAMGNRDLTDGTFVWPEGLAHYVEVHDVLLPPRFVTHAVFDAPPPTRPGRRPILDDEPWITWSRAQGACLDLDGWEVPGATDLARIEPLLGATAGTVVLARADTRHVVLAHRDGSLEIRHLARTAPEPPRTLPGWDAWPILATREPRPRPDAPPTPAAPRRSRPTRRR